MNRRAATALLACLAACPPGAAAISHEERKASPAEAIAMVTKAVAAIRSQGREAAYDTISRKDGAFVDRDLYVTVWGMDGTVRAHGLNPTMVGRNLIDLKDIDGKPFIRERIAQAHVSTAFWQDYQYTHPQSRRIEPKRMYCQRLDDSVVCSGVYK